MELNLQFYWFGLVFYLKDFIGKKDFLRDLIFMEYEINLNDLDKLDDVQLWFIYIVFDWLVNYVKVVIIFEYILWNVLFEVNCKEFYKERSKLFYFQFKFEIQR